MHKVAVFFQLVTLSGRFPMADAPLERLAHSEVIGAIAHLLPKSAHEDGFVPVTCSSRTCRSRDLRALDEHDLVPSPRLVDVGDDLDHVSKPPFLTSSCNCARWALGAAARRRGISAGVIASDFPKNLGLFGEPSSWGVT
jgi:hypothetical protein